MIDAKADKRVSQEFARNKRYLRGLGCFVKLGLVTRLWLISFALLSCKFDPGPEASATTSGDTGNCVPGQVDCVCFEDFTCFPGLICFYGECVIPNAGTSTGSDSTSVGSTSQDSTSDGSTSHESTESSSASVGSETSGGTGGTENTSETEAEDSVSDSEASTGESSTTSETSESSESSGNDETEGGDCIPHHRECIDLTQYHVCSAEGQWGPPMPCVHQACRDGECVGECSPGEKRCQGNSVERCNDWGAWETHTVCDSPEEVCEDGKCIEACTPWVWQEGTSEKDESIGIALDASGSAYLTGFTQGALGGQSSAGGKDIFVVRLNSAGQKIWIRQRGTNFDDEGFKIAADDTGNVYVTGYTDGKLGGNSQAKDRDLFLAKYNSGGVEAWTKQLGSESADISNPDDSSHGLGVDKQGNAFIAGRTNGTFKGQSSAGGVDFFVMRFSSTGVRSWTRQIGTSGEDHGIGVAVGAEGSRVYITGFTEGSLHGSTHFGEKDIFVATFDSLGNHDWTRQLGNSTWNEGYAIALDSMGNAYITGATGGSLGSNESAGLGDFFVAKYSPSGVNVWTKQLGTAGMESGLGIAVDASGNSYITGPTNGTFPENSSAGSDDDDIFVAKVDRHGEQQWIRQFGTPNGDWGIAIALDDSGNAYVTGYVGGSLEGQPWSGGRDLFAARICSDGRMFSK